MEEMVLLLENRDTAAALSTLQTAGKGELNNEATIIWHQAQEKHMATASVPSFRACPLPFPLLTLFSELQPLLACCLSGNATAQYGNAFVT